MRTIIAKSVFILFSLALFSQHAHAGDDQMSSASSDSLPRNVFNIIPNPLMVTAHSGFFHINESTVLVLPSNTSNESHKIFQGCLELISGIHLPVQQRASGNDIQLLIDSVSVPLSEGYKLEIDPKHITITGHDEAGIFYGLQSLIQLSAQSENNSLPSCTIVDHPRFAYRGMHLDVCRHFFSVASIKKWLDLLALYKINTFHWHLTDDQGWRIEIKKYPALQTISAYRNETLIGHKKELPHVFDGKRYGGYYSQEEVKQVVQYAAERHINIIPEIEMPGHALAALAAYPNLGCTGGPYQTATFWGIFSDVYCAGNDSTFIFLQNVMDEVLELFPSKYIHIGGDECPKIRWHQCPKCQRRMAEEHLKDENELQSYVIKRMERYLNSKGRQIIGWDEILEGGLSPGATVMSWTGEHGGIEAAKQHHTVVMTPEKFVYMDYYQSLYPGEPLAGGGYLPLNKIYNYNPLPEALSPEESRYIIGVQANVWSEYMDNEASAEYMMFPRVLALAEMGWSANEKRNYNDFLKRLRSQEKMLNKMAIHYANTFDEITYSIGKNEHGKTNVILETTLPRGIIRFTTDGKNPDKNAAIYRDGLTIDKDETLQAAVFLNGVQQGRVFSKKFLFHKAVGKSVKLAFQPADNFNPGVEALVNGIEASNTYNDGQWFGFSGVDLNAVIDLGSIQDIRVIGMNFLKYHWQKMWEPVELTFWTSTNGIQYKKIYSLKDFPINGINPVRAEFENTKARYIKVVGVNKGIIPPGEYIEGAKAILMVDEIFVY